MGEDDRAKEWYKWTMYYMLGEDGFIYSRYEEITTKLTNGSTYVRSDTAVKVETKEDFARVDEFHETGLDGRRSAPLDKSSDAD